MGVLLSFLAALTLGAIAATQLSIGLLPEVAIPRISVQITYPNTAARNLETNVVTPLRNTLLQLNQLADIQSRTRDESAVIYLDFPYGTNPNLAFIEVNEKIDQAMSQLPRELERPRVLSTDISEIPVVQLAVSLRNTSNSASATEALLELSELAQKVLRRRLEQLPQIAFADLTGQLEPQISIQLDEQQMRSLGISEAELVTAIQTANRELGSMLIRDGYYQYSVRLAGELRTAEDLAQLYLNFRNRNLQLAELATVKLSARPTRGYFLHQNELGIAFQLRRRANSSLLDLQRDLNVLLKDLSEEYPQLRFELNNDQTRILRLSINNLLSGLAYGAGFAVFTLFLFFREWQRPLLIALAVPLGLIVTLLGFYLLDLSINVISLAGLILGLGLMIDNSIIVLDNIQQFIQGGENPRSAALRGGDEVIRPLIASAMTTIAVFLPLVFLSGIAGSLFRDQALAVSLSLAASLITAYLLLPLLSRKTYRSGHSVEPQRESVSHFERSVNLGLRFLWVVLMMGAALITLAYFSSRQLERRSFPALSRTDYQLQLDWNTALSLEDNLIRTQALCTRWQELVSGTTAASVGEKQFFLEVENQAINTSEIQFYLDSPPQNAEFAAAFLAEIRSTYPSARLSFRALPNLFDRVFLNDEAYLSLKIRDATSRESPDWSRVVPFLEQVTAENTYAELPALKEVIRLSIDYEKLRIHRVTDTQLQGRLLSLFNENEVTQLFNNDQRLRVVIGQPTLISRLALLSSTVLNENGNEISLGQLIDLELTTDYKVLTADQQGEYLSCQFPFVLPQEERLRIQSAATRAEGLSCQFRGRFYTDQDRIGELNQILLVSLLLLFLILAAQFESLRLPLIVLMVIPLSLAGALLALWLTNTSLNLVSLIGMVVTGGIVINDAILKIDIIERELQKGAKLTNAIHTAGRRRLRAIVMTSLTTILALGPVLFSSGLGAELQAPLAISVIGGLSFGTLASLYLIPVLYLLFSSRKK